MKIINTLICLSGIMLMLTSCIFEPVDQNLEGNWICTETSEIFLKGMHDAAGTSVFPVYIAQDATYDNQYYIQNFYQLGNSVQVKIMVSGGSTVTIETQTAGGVEFSGSGTISVSYDRITLNYTADDGGGELDQVEAEFVREQMQ